MIIYGNDENMIYQPSGSMYCVNHRNDGPSQIKFYGRETYALENGKHIAIEHNGLVLIHDCFSTGELAESVKLL